MTDVRAVAGGVIFVAWTSPLGSSDGCRCMGGALSGSGGGVSEGDALLAWLPAAACSPEWSRARQDPLLEIERSWRPCQPACSPDSSGEEDRTLATEHADSREGYVQVSGKGLSPRASSSLDCPSAGIHTVVDSKAVDSIRLKTFESSYAYMAGSHPSPEQL